MSQWIGFDPHAADYIGLLHEIFDARDERPAAEQANDRYAHGGGWKPMKGWKLTYAGYQIEYPGDEPLDPVAAYSLPLTKEVVFVYPHGFVMIIDDRSHQIARMD